MSSVNAQSAGDEKEQKKTFKEQLDEAASTASPPKDDNANQGGVVDTVVEKVSEYVPAVGKVLGQEHHDAPPETQSKIPGPPELPHHATQVEEFLREQHRSRKEDGELAEQ